MKTIVRKSDNVSLYLYPDDKDITLEAARTVIGPTDNPDIYVSDCNFNNVDLLTGVDDKSDWWGHKYKHDGSSWSANADYKGLGRSTEAINDSVTTIPVVNSNPFTTSGTVQIEDEKITYTGVDGTNLTGCTRGAASTSAANHSQSIEIRQV